MHQHFRMKPFALAVLCAMLHAPLLAQHSRPSPPSSLEHLQAQAAVHSELIQCAMAGEAGIGASTVRWANKLTRLSPRPHHLPEVEALKASKLAEKMRSTLPLNDNEEGNAKSVNPVVAANFEANWSVQSTPPDNSMAISNAGRIVSVNNDEIVYMNASGQLLEFQSWADFVDDASLTASLYDPKVIYDSQADRFVLALLHGSTAETSKVILCFSQTNDPQQGWWKYYLTGNPLNNNCWFDYPGLGVSNNEVYVTGNLFTSGNNQFNQAIIYQVTKALGYAGGNINWQYWSNLSATPYAAFTLQPASYGQQGNYGPGVYFVSSAAGGANALRVWDLTNDLGANPALNAYTVSVTPYSPAAPANQLGSSNLLDNGDCRVLSAFFLNGRIHCVFGTDAGSGWNGIRYTRIATSNMSATQATLGAVGSSDYCFPALASFGTTATDTDVMIAFLRSSGGIYPEARVVNCDAALSWSPTTLMKSGETFVNFLQGQQRWGDYTGMCRKHNASQPTVWAAACYGASIPQASTANTYKTWVAEIQGAGTVDLPEATEAPSALRLYPNPAIDYFHMDFNVQERAKLRIAVLDARGALVKLLYEEERSPADYRFTFNRGALSAGAYSLVIHANETLIGHETLVIH